MSVQNSCGWGSASLYFAEKLPSAKITAFSNSKTQKEHIDGEAKRKGLKNLQVLTGDVVDYEFEPEQYDRVVSIEVYAARSRPFLDATTNSFTSYLNT